MHSEREWGGGGGGGTCRTNNIYLVLYYLSLTGPHYQIVVQLHPDSISMTKLLRIVPWHIRLCHWTKIEEKKDTIVLCSDEVATSRCVLGYIHVYTVIQWRKKMPLTRGADYRRYARKILKHHPLLLTTPISHVSLDLIHAIGGMYVHFSVPGAFYNL